jgi:hypothetical protein
VRNRRIVGPGIVCGTAGVVLFASACGGGTTPTQAGSPSSPATPAQKVLLGTKLQSLLLPASTMPKGFTLSKDGARNSGDGVAPPSNAPVAPGKVCAMLEQTAWVRAAGIDSATFAQNDYVDSAHENQVAQELDTFQGGGAHTVMTQLARVFTHCKSFKDTSGVSLSTVKIASSKLSGIGDEGIKAVATSPAWSGGETLVAARVGQTVITTFYSSSHKDRGAAAVQYTRSLAKKVEAAG